MHRVVIRVVSAIILAACCHAYGEDGIAISTHRAGGSDTGVAVHPSMFGQVVRHDIKDNRVMKRTVLYDGRAHAAVINQTGEKVAFVKLDGHIWLMNIDGSNLHELSNTRNHNGSSLDWPAGDWIYYNEECRWPTGNWFTGETDSPTARTIRRVNAVTGEDEHVCVTNYPIWQISLSRNAGKEGGRFAITNMLLDFGAPGNRLNKTGLACGTTVSPGGQFVTEVKETHADIRVYDWSLDNVIREFHVNEFNPVGNDGRVSLYRPRWAVNSEKWVVFTQGADFGCTLKTNMVIYNWKDGRQIQVTTNDITGSESDEGEDFWLAGVANELGTGIAEGEAPFTVELGKDKLQGEWQWDFGDGTKDAATVGTHTYVEAGEFTVSATRGGTVLHQTVRISPRHAPQPVSIDPLDDRRLLITFNERIQLKEPAAILASSGARSATITPSSTGPSVVAEFSDPLKHPDQLTLEGIYDCAQVPNEVADAKVDFTFPDWPTNRDRLAYLWENNRARNLIYIPSLKAELQTGVFVWDGQSRFDRNGALLGGRGPVKSTFHAMPVGNDRYPFISATEMIEQAATEAVTIEAVVRAANLTQQDESGMMPIIAMTEYNYGLRKGVLWLGQQKKKLLLLLGTDKINVTTATPMEIGEIPDTDPHHIIISYTSGNLVFHLDGKERFRTDKITGRPLAGASSCRLTFAGDPRSEQGLWSGSIEGVAFYGRAFDAAHAKADYEAYAALLAGRKKPPKLEVEAKLVEASRVDDLGQIAPYDEAFVIDEYEVVKVLSGTYDVPKIRCAQWSVIRKKIQPINKAKIGTVSRLVLEPYRDNPQLESVFIVDALSENFDLDLYVEVKPDEQAVSTVDDGRPPFRIRYELPVAGDFSAAIDRPDGRRVLNCEAQVPREQGAAEFTWDLKDADGNFVAPGTYVFKAVVAPQLELGYGVTPCPDIQDFFPERTPWPVDNAEENGWLSSRSGIHACATAGDRVYFGSPTGDADANLIECDLDGRRLHRISALDGLSGIAADGESLFVLTSGGMIQRFDLQSRKLRSQFRLDRGSRRRGWCKSMAARDGEIYLAFAGKRFPENAAATELLAFEHCLPSPPDRSLAQLLRMEGSPPGKDVNPRSNEPQGNGRLYLESQPLGNNRVSVIAFKQPVPLGSIVFPWPDGEGTLQFAVLKPDAPWPPRPDQDPDWTPFQSSGGPGWNCVHAPPQTTTRALRVLFQPKDKDSGFWRLDGLRLLDRRLANLFPAARVRVNSGTVDPTGGWDAQRTVPVTAETPGVYVMDWPTPQKIRGLAIKEIDGAIAGIDVWQGPMAGEIPLDGAALADGSDRPGWRHIATYVQERRVSDYAPECNRYARYMDGYVDFRELVETRAVRIRITDQWTDNGPRENSCRLHDGRSEHGVHIRHSYCMWLDTRVCKVMGVAPLSPLGSDPPTDPLTCERIEVWNGNTGQFEKELPAAPGLNGLSIAPGGSLYVAGSDLHNILRVDLGTGEMTPVVRDVAVSTFTIGPDGSFYIFSSNRQAVLVYNAQGQEVRQIGKSGGFRPGLWDPQRFGQVQQICADGAGSLWAVESQENPRRVVQYKTDGTFVKEIIGNTCQGGCGTLDRANPSRAFHGATEIAIDWANHTSSIRAYFGNGFLGRDVVAVHRNGRTYLVTAPLAARDLQSVAIVYLFNEQQGTVKLAAAMGDAGAFPPLEEPGIISILPDGTVPRSYEFLWFDRNGNGRVDAAEVDLQNKKEGGAAVGWIDPSLGCIGNRVYYQVAEFLPNGVPSYVRKETSYWGVCRLNNGNTLVLQANYDKASPMENYVVTPTGAKLWSYPVNQPGFGYVPPARPGVVTNQFGVIGHETAKGDLGEFVVVQAFTGQWNIWTVDGLLAGQVMYHRGDKRGSSFGSVTSPRPGAGIAPLAASTEQYHGFFTKSEPDGKYYMVTGSNHMTIAEVRGIDSIRRIEVQVTVSSRDIREAWDWAERQAKKKE